MGTILEMLFQFILVFPGAFFRWILSGRRRKYSDYLDSSPDVNVLVSILVFASLYAMAKWIFP
jgi:hypothetical protein